MTTYLTARLIGLILGALIGLVIVAVKVARDPQAIREIKDGIDALRFGRLD